MTHSKRTTSWVALAALAASLACGGGGDGGSTTPPPPDNSPASITLSATGAVTLVSGNTLNVTANVLTRDGRPVTGASVVWASSNTQVASVNGGLITAVLVGTTQITASVGSVVSAPLAVTTTPGAATRLGLRTQPGGAAVGARFVTQPVVEFLDAAGNVVTTSAGAVNAAIASGGGTLAGTATVAATNGVATFSDLGLSGTIGNRTLSFSTAGLATVTSAAFALAPGAPAAMVVRRQPVGGAVGAALLTQPIIELRDVSGNVSTGSTAVVTAGLTGFTGTVGGTVAVPAVAGVATFTNLVVSGQPGTYALAFSSTGIPGVAAAPMALPAIIYGLSNEKVQFLDAGASSTASLSSGGPAGFLSRAANRVSIDNNGRFTAVAEGQSWLLGFNNLGADSVLAVVTRSAGGPVARTTLSNYVMRTGDTTYFRLVLDPRNTPVGAFTVVVNFNSQDFSPRYQIGTRDLPNASITAAQSDPNVFRFSVVTTTPLTAPVEFGEVLLISGPANARLAMTVQAIEIFGPDGADLFSRVTSTFYPLVFR